MPLHYDPLSPEIRTDPYPTYAALRRREPVVRMPAGGVALARYSDVRRALSRPDLLSSSAMGALIQRVDEDDEPDEQYPETLLGSDPPQHTGLRKLANRGFSRRLIAALEGRIREVARSLANELRRRDDFDLVSDFSAPLTIRVIADLLGVDPERHADFRRWSDALILIATGAPQGETLERAMQEKREFSEYLHAIIDERRRIPRDDLISALVRLESSEGPMRPTEVDFLPQLLLIAGNETTTHLISNLMSALFEHPDQMELLNERPSWIPAAVEEGLRFDSPIQVVLRTATRAIEFGGCEIEAGTTVALLLGSANRDERVFLRPDRFDVTRNPSGHLAFGLGTHFCLGAPLARLEARIALETLLPMELQAAGPAGERIASLLVRGVASLPVARRSLERRAG